MSDSALSSLPASAANAAQTWAGVTRPEGEDWFQLSALAASDATSGTYPSLSSFGLEKLPTPQPGAAEPGAAFQMPPHELPQIDGYEIISILGGGGVGLVYKARQVGLNRIVALKMLRLSGTAFADDLARFRAEAEAVAALQHPNIVQIHDIGKYRGVPFISLEYVDGGTLHERLKARPQEPAYAAKLVRILAEAIQAAHDRGIVHRDLKPGNILLTRGGVPKITDFGLALRLAEDSHLTQTGQILGTPSYMSPEQAAGNRDQIGPPVDIHALGAILYEVLTGRAPYQGVSGRDTVLQVLQLDPIPPRRLQPAVPADLETICLKCLQKEPGHRYASAAALADDLARFEQGLPILARPVRNTEKLIRWARRRPREAALLAAVAVMVVVIGVGAGWFLQARSKAREEFAGRLGEAIAEVEGKYDVARRSVSPPDKWHEAQKAVESAAALVRDRGDFPDQRKRILQMRADIDEGLKAAEKRASTQHDEQVLRQTIDAARIRSVQARPTTQERQAQAGEYSRLLAQAGIGLGEMSYSQTADRIKVSPLSEHLVAILLEWTILTARDQTAEDVLRRGILKQIHADEKSGVVNRLWAHYEQGEWRALANLSQAWDGRMQPPAATFALARMLHGRGFGPEALAVLERGVIHHPENLWLTHELAWCHQYCPAPHLDVAISYYRAAVALNPSLPGLWTSLGVALSDKGEFEEACQVHERACDFNPRATEPRCHLASTLTRMGRFDAAVQQLNDVLRDEPTNLDAWLGIAAARLRQRRADEAIVALNMAVKHHPASARAQCEMGLALLELGGRDDAALEAFRKAVKLAPDYAAAHHGLGLVLMRAGQHSAAEQSFVSAVQSAPDEPLYHRRRAETLAQLGRLDEALAALDEAKRRKPGDPATLIQIAKTCARKRDLSRSEFWYRETIRHAPDQAEPQQRLGDLLLTNKRFGEAAAAYRQALHLQADLPGVRARLVSALVLDGKLVLSFRIAWH